MEKQKELTERVRSNEKFIAGVGAVGTLAIAALGFIGSAEAEVTDKSFSAGQWIQDVRDWESEKNRTPIDETLNSALIMHEEKNLFPNVDYYGGLLLSELGFEVDLFTPIFVAGRSVGWAAHYFEQRQQDTLIRPAAKYIGIEERE